MLRNKNFLIGIASAVGVFLLMGIAFRAGQANSFSTGGNNDFDGRNGCFDREFSFESEEEIQEFLAERENREGTDGREAGGSDNGDRDNRDGRGGDRDGRDGRGGDRDGRDGRGRGHGGRGGGVIFGIFGFLIRLAMLGGVIWAAVNWDKVQSWWNSRRGSTTTTPDDGDDDDDDPIPAGKEVAVAGIEPDEPAAEGDEPTDDAPAPADDGDDDNAEASS